MALGPCFLLLAKFVVCGGDFHSSIYHTFHSTTLFPSLPSQYSSYAFLPSPSSRYTRHTYLSDPFQDITIVTTPPINTPATVTAGSFSSIGVGPSCEQLCSSNGGLRCEEYLLTLLSTNCTMLKQIFHCESCIDADGPHQGFIAPGMETNVKQMLSYATNEEEKKKISKYENVCILSKGKYVRCNATPYSPTYRRACTCLTNT